MKIVNVTSLGAREVPNAPPGIQFVTSFFMLKIVFIVRNHDSPLKKGRIYEIMESFKGLYLYFEPGSLILDRDEANLRLPWDENF